MIDIKNCSKEELVKELEKSKSETFKYVNRLLEIEEKWAFINILLKKLNSTKRKQDICELLASGFLDLTASKVCACAIFNPDKRIIDNYSYKFCECIKEHDLILERINHINEFCKEYLKNSDATEKISNYFELISNNDTIIVPISFENIFYGYLMLVKEEDNFYQENIKFINVFPDHIALVLENISLYQKSEKRNKQKIEFLASISHEFKTPLNSIIGFADILANSSGKNKLDKYIQNILQSAKYLLVLIEDVLDVSKSQYKELELNYSKFSPKEEILQIISSLETMMQDKNINIRYTLIETEIEADLKRFKQLIYNLTSNAIKFNKNKGSINILTYIEDDNFFCEFEDTGDGISKNDYDKIFDFFSQVNRNQLKRQLGSGVGLALCKMITNAHGGEINFKSQYAKGSTFWFSLPLKRS